MTALLLPPSSFPTTVILTPESNPSPSSGPSPEPSPSPSSSPSPTSSLSPTPIPTRPSSPTLLNSIIITSSPDPPTPPPTPPPDIFSQHSTSTSTSTSTTASSSPYMDDFIDPIDPTHVHLGNPPVKLGDGTYGDVYCCKLLHKNKIINCCRKAFHEESPTCIPGIRDEINIMRRLHQHHHYFPHIYGCNLEIPRYFFVMEYCERGSLHHIITKESHLLSYQKRIHILWDVAVALSYLHTHDPPIIHHDLKSENIVVRDAWTVCITDFGLAQLKHQSLVASSTQQTIRPGQLVGTYEWMAPEMILKQGLEYTPALDIYAFGILMWQVATDRIPWEGKKLSGIIKAVRAEQRPDSIIPVDETQYDTWYIKLMKWCWSQDPEKRPTSQQISNELGQQIYLLKKNAISSPSSFTSSSTVQLMN